nr:hypothetical protein [Ceratocystis fimbriata]
MCRLIELTEFYKRISLTQFWICLIIVSRGIQGWSTGLRKGIPNKVPFRSTKLESGSRDWSLILVPTASSTTHDEANELGTYKCDRFSGIVLKTIVWLCNSLNMLMIQSNIFNWARIRDSRWGFYENKCTQASKSGYNVSLRTREATAYGTSGLGGLVVDSLNKRLLKQDRLGVTMFQIPYNSIYKVPGEVKRLSTVAKTATANDGIVRAKLSECKLGSKYYKLMDIIANKEFLINAYNSIRSNPGNMTRGADNETLDEINEKYFNDIAMELKTGKFKFRPGRVVLIPKKDGKFRTLTIVSPRDKIIQKAITMVLQAIWEPLFHDSSHGFRPNRSTHSALKEIFLKGDNYNWVIQGDITKCFDNIPHKSIRKAVSEHIGDMALLQLINKWLKAGRIIDKRLARHKEKGVPQGGVLSPLISNIVLHSLDEYMANYKNKFETGKLRKRNPEYAKLIYKRRVTKDPNIAAELTKKIRNTPSVISMDPNFKRIMYIRYADDFVVLTSSSKNEVIHIKNNIKDILKNKCGSELNDEKTTITNIRQTFDFLGARIRKPLNNNFLVNRKGSRIKVQTRMLVLAPIEELIDKLVKTGFAYKDKNGDVLPQAYNALINMDHYSIITFYNSKINGLLNYYSFATNYNRLRFILWNLQASCAMTLGAKYKKSMRAIFSQFGKNLVDPETDRGLNLPKNMKVRHNFNNKDTKVDPFKNLELTWSGKLTETTFGKGCSICGSNTDLEMHHIRKVADVRHKMRTGTSTYAEWIGATKRKQIPLCQYHHQMLHKGQLSYHELKLITSYNK